MKMRLKEHRDSQRLVVQLPLWLRKDSGPYQRTYTLDLNASGAQILLDVSLTPGSLIDVQLKLPGSLFTLRARVVWVRPSQDGRFEAGLAFLPSPSADLLRLRRWHHAEASRVQLTA